MKTLNDLQNLIFEAIKLESFNNFLVKYSVNYTMLPNGLLSFTLCYRNKDTNEILNKPIDFLFNPSEISENQVQAYYWQLNLILERHYV